PGRDRASSSFCRRCVGPEQVGQFHLRASGDQTLLFSLRENAIAKEPGLGYPERWRCVSRLGRFTGGLDSFESSPDPDLSARPGKLSGGGSLQPEYAPLRRARYRIRAVRRPRVTPRRAEACAFTRCRLLVVNERSRVGGSRWANDLD